MARNPNKLLVISLCSTGHSYNSSRLISCTLISYILTAGSPFPFQPPLAGPLINEASPVALGGILGGTPQRPLVGRGGNVFSRLTSFQREVRHRWEGLSAGGGPSKLALIAGREKDCSARKTIRVVGSSGSPGVLFQCSFNLFYILKKHSASK